MAQSQLKIEAGPFLEDKPEVSHAKSEQGKLYICLQHVAPDIFKVSFCIKDVLPA